jgi:hypothetical protein
MKTKKQNTPIQQDNEFYDDTNSELLREANEARTRVYKAIVDKNQKKMEQDKIGEVIAEIVIDPKEVKQLVKLFQKEIRKAREETVEGLFGWIGQILESDRGKAERFYLERVAQKYGFTTYGLGIEASKIKDFLADLAKGGKK